MQLGSKLLRSKSGQAVIEFVLSLMFLMGLVVFIIHLSMSMAIGNYIHYATFMSARALLSSALNEAAQKENAEEVISKMLKNGTRFSGWIEPSLAGGGRFPGAKIITNPSSWSGVNNHRASSWMSGVLYQFNMKVFMGPISGSAGSKISLTSESWLGRETSSAECAQKVRALQQGEVFIDNGC
ncbi:MAG: hypothetical protein KA715_04485 [Xanthomonadaceae bacterium]|nr:hypothetical protein [Xanthomonadaceae bacterium]